MIFSSSLGTAGSWCLVVVNAQGVISTNDQSPPAWNHSDSLVRKSSEDRHERPTSRRRRARMAKAQTHPRASAQGRPGECHPPVAGCHTRRSTDLRTVRTHFIFFLQWLPVHTTPGLQILKNSLQRISIGCLLSVVMTFLRRGMLLVVELTLGTLPVWMRRTKGMAPKQRVCLRNP